MIRKHSYIHFLILIDILTINNQLSVKLFPKCKNSNYKFGNTWTCTTHGNTHHEHSYIKYFTSRTRSVEL